MLSWRIWVGSIVTVLGDVVLRRWSVSSEAWALLGGVLCWVVDALLWAWHLRVCGGLAHGAALWGVLTLVLAVAAGHLIYQERLGAREWAGVALAVVATLCLTK